MPYKDLQFNPKRSLLTTYTRMSDSGGVRTVRKGWIRYDPYSSIFPIGIQKDTDLAYAAGFIDGEGCIYGKEIRVTNTNEEVLIWFKKTFGGKIYIRKKQRDRLQVYVWRIANKEAEVFIKKLKPFLKVKKKACLQCKIMQNNA